MNVWVAWLLEVAIMVAGAWVLDTIIRHLWRK